MLVGSGVAAGSMGSILHLGVGGLWGGLKRAQSESGGLGRP